MAAHQSFWHGLVSFSLEVDKQAAAGIVSLITRISASLQPLAETCLMLQIAAFRLTLLVTAVIAAAALLTWALAETAKEIRRFFVLFRIPHPPDESFLLGSVVPMRRKDHHRSLRAWSKQLGGVYAIRIAFWHLVVVADAELANSVLGTQEGLSKGLEPDLSDKLLSHGGHRTMFSSDTNSPYWRLIRKGTAPAFIYKNIKNGFSDVLRILDQVISNLRQLAPHDDVDINNVTLRYALDVTGLVGFAKDFGTARSFSDAGTDELFTIIQDSFRELYCRASNPARHLMLWLPEVRNANPMFRNFRRRMMQLLQEVKARGEPGPDDVSIAAHLLRLRDPTTGQPLPDDLLAGEFGLFFSAGIESAGNAISWTLYLVSEHPEVELKLVAELDAAGLLVTGERPQPRPMVYADLGRLTYLSWVCKEAMRVRPVASTGVSRYTKRDMVLGGHYVPAGTLLDVPFDAVHHFPGNWPQDPDAFIPERWAVPGAELVSSKEIPFKGAAQGTGDATAAAAGSDNGEDGLDDSVGGAKRFLPFSTGPRQCIGQSLGRIMHDVAVAGLLAHFTFQLAPRMGGPAGVDEKEINRLTLQPGGGLWMRVRHRSKLAEPPSNGHEK